MPDLFFKRSYFGVKMFVKMTKRERCTSGRCLQSGRPVLSPVLTQLCNLRAASVGKRKSEDRSDRWRGETHTHTKRLLSFYGLPGTNEESAAHRLVLHFVEEVSAKKATTRLLIVFSSISCYSKKICVSKNVRFLWK